MIITSNRRSQQTPSTKGGKGKIQWLDWVSCPDTEIQVLPNLGITVDQVSCPDTNIGVLTTRFPRASCFKETHAFCSRNMGVHVQCTCAKKLVSSNFAKKMHYYVWKKMSWHGGKLPLDRVSCPDTKASSLTLACLLEVWPNGLEHNNFHFSFLVKCE